MSYATNVGKAIALQRPRREDYWMRRLADDIQAKEAAAAKQKEKDEEEIAKLMDINIDYSKYLPAWAKEIGKEYANMIGKVAQLRQENPNVSKYAIKQEILKSRERMNSYIVGNEAAKEYLKKDDIYKPANLLAAMTSTDSNLNDLSKMSNPQFYNITPTGGFSYNPVSNKEPQIQFGDFDIIDKPTGKTFFENGERYRETVSSYSDQSKQIAYTRLRNDPVFVARTAIELGAENPEYRQKQGEKREDYFARIAQPIDLKAQQVTDSLEPTKKIKYGVIPERAGGKEKEITLVQPSYSEATIMKDDGTTAQAQRLSASLPGVNKGITIQLNKSFIDANSNKNIPASLTGTINFRPDQLVAIKNSQTGKWEKYILGTSTESVDSPTTLNNAALLELLKKSDPESYNKISESQRKSLEKSFSFLVPYETSGVKSLIESSKMDFSEFDKQYNQLRSGTHEFRNGQLVPKSGGATGVSSYKYRVAGTGNKPDIYSPNGTDWYTIDGNKVQ